MISTRSFFGSLGRFVVRFRYYVVLVWVFGTAMAVFNLPSLSAVAKSDDSAFLPASTPSIVAGRLAAPFQQQNASSALIVASRGDARLTAADQRSIAATERSIGHIEHVREVRDEGISHDGRAQRAFVQLDLERGSDGTAARLVVRQIRARLQKAEAPGLQLHLTGDLPLRVDRLSESHSMQKNAELYSVAFIVILLLLVFRSLLAPLLTLLPAVLALVLAGPVIAESTRIGVQVSDITQVLLVVVMLGAGTDYGLFLIFRVREELSKGLAPGEAVARSVERVGETITFSAATVAVALVTLLLATFGFYSGLGPALAIGVVLLLLAGLTLLPALISIFGRAVFWPSKPKPGKIYRGLWGQIAGRIVRRPATTLAIGVVLFAGLSLALLAYAANGFGGSSVPARSDSARGQAVIARHFVAAAANPTSILFRLPRSVWTDTSRLGPVDGSLEQSGLFTSLSGPLNPNGTPLTPARLQALHRRLGAPGRLPEHRPVGVGVPDTLYQAYRATAQFVSPDGRTIQLYASLVAGDSSSDAARDAIPAVRGAVTRAAGVFGAETSGVLSRAAGAYDVNVISSRDLLQIIPIVLLAIGILLAVLLRSLVAPIYLILSVGLSYLAALGLAVLVFVVIVGEGGLKFVLPFLMFIFLMALGEDYNILVMSRIREEARHHPLREAVTRAVAATGTTVTSAGLILAGTFGVLTISGSGEVRQIGLGLAAGILLDTFLVRTLLVPSTVSLMGRWNWWPSGLGRRLQAVPVAVAEPLLRRELPGGRRHEDE
ncbi:MAG: MMPL family transporter [Gaiellaceae bacterium]